MKKVKDVYNIDEDDLQNVSETSDYWENSYNFYMQVKEWDIGSLSGAQKNWLDKIETSLEDPFNDSVYR